MPLRAIVIPAEERRKRGQDAQLKLMVVAQYGDVILKNVSNPMSFSLKKATDDAVTEFCSQ